MQRREFLKSLGAGGVLLAQSGCAQGLGQRIGDGALALGSAVKPSEREEKRRYPDATRDVVWSTTVHHDGYHRETFNNCDAYVERLADATGVPVVTGPLVRRDAAPAGQSGFFLYFGTMVGILLLPQSRPPELISSTGRHFFTGNILQLRKRRYPRDHASFDYRRIRLIEDGRVHLPTGELWTSGGNPISERPMTGPVVYPGTQIEDWNFHIRGVVRFATANRPLRFTLELPPLLVQGVEVPMPTCFFEPYDTLRDQWV